VRTALSEIAADEQRHALSGASQPARCSAAARGRSSPPAGRRRDQQRR
jgi:hypothetical protein